MYIEAIKMGSITYHKMYCYAHMHKYVQVEKGIGPTTCTSSACSKSIVYEITIDHQHSEKQSIPLDLKSTTIQQYLYNLVRDLILLGRQVGRSIPSKSSYPL
jgi:hypothetical protein